MGATAICLAGILAAAGATSADPRESARAVLERGGYQRQLPTASPPPSGASESRVERSSGSGASGAPRERRAPPRSSSPPPSIPLPPAGFVWALLAGVIVIALAWAALQARGARRGADADPSPEPEPAAPPARRALRIGPLTDVEDLARQGRFGEAIHLLLLHLFAALQRRPATAPAPAHTSREVLARTRLASEAKAALGVLVAAAEAIHFGGRQAAREDYENCLGHYRRFLDAFERAS